jgi:signal transduction histidine kinase
MLEIGSARSLRFLRSRAAEVHAASHIKIQQWGGRLRQHTARWPSPLWTVADRSLPAILLGLALTVGVVPLLEYWPGPKAELVQITPLLFLIPVVLASNSGGWWSGVFVSFIAVGIWNWFFLLPAQSLGIESTDDLVTLLVYFAVAALVGELSSAARHRARIARRRQAELAAISDVTNAAASTLDLTALLTLVLDRVHTVIESTSTAVILKDGDQIRVVDYRGPTPQAPIVGQAWPVSGATVYQELARRRAPISLADLLDGSPEAQTFGDAFQVRVLGQHQQRSWLWIPLISREQVIGLISFSHQAPNAYTAHHTDLALTVANPVAVAIENARLYTQSQAVAVLEERSRLARDLHDSVTQMLFSSSLIAEVLPRLWERDQEAARQSLEDLRLLARGASAEMRTLLVELRPAALGETRLADLLRQVAEAMTARTQIPILLTVEGEHVLPPNVRVAVYRIAQQALSNAARHAEPSSITVRLKVGTEGVELDIRDDGCGFDLAGVRPGRFGLGTMRERADGIGAKLSVKSARGIGTQVVVAWTAPTQ